VSFAVAAGGELRYRSRRWPEPLSARPLPRPGPRGEAFALLEGAAPQAWRVGAFRDGDATVYVAVDLERFHAHAARLHGVFLLALVVALGAAGAGAWWLSGRALRPLETLTEAAEGITVDQLSRRIESVSSDEEFARLIAVFNAMLERLERSYGQALRFSADVSHELKTPLTVMQGEVEAALAEVEEGSPAQRALAAQLEELQRLKGMVARLLLLSRADAGTLRPRREPIDLAACVEELCEDLVALQPELHLERELEPVQVAGDPSLLPLIPRNLLDNAAKHGDPAGPIRVTLRAEGQRALLRVENAGPAIEGEARERVFDRFYRVDPARGREAGAGLGLSLARELARAHGGELSLLPGEATVFELWLPRLDGECSTEPAAPAPALGT